MAVRCPLPVTSWSRLLTTQRTVRCLSAALAVNKHAKSKQVQEPHVLTPTPPFGVLQKMQQMEENRIKKLAEGYGLLADTEKKTLPSISQNLEKISAYSSNTYEKQVHTHTHTQRTTPAYCRSPVKHECVSISGLSDPH